jgi:hypothetical protein
MIWLLAHPLPSVSSTGDNQENEKERQLADGRAVEEPYHTTARKSGEETLVPSFLYK